MIYYLYQNILNFSYMSQIHFLLKNMSFKLMGTKTPKTATFPWGNGGPSNTPIPRPTLLTTPNDSSISSCTFAELCNKVPIVYNGMPHIYLQNCPFPLNDHHHIWYTYSSTDPTHHPKQHPDPTSQFATVHFPHRLTERQTDWQMGQAKVLFQYHLCSIVLIESYALIMTEIVHCPSTAHHRIHNCQHPHLCHKCTDLFLTCHWSITTELLLLQLLSVLV